MSTKIYNGLIADGPLGVTHQNLMQIKDDMRSIALKGVHSWLARHACQILDNMAMSDRAITRMVAQHRSVYSTIRDKLDHAYAEVKKGHRQPGIDYDSEVLLFPFGNKTLLFPIIESSEQYEHLKSQPWCAEYGYWDNSDGPDDISDEEFQERGKVWDEVIGKTGVPAENGLTFQLSSNFDMQVRFSLEGIVEAMPSMDERVKRYVDDKMLTSKVDELARTLPGEEWDALKTRPYSTIMRAQELLKSDEAKAERAELEEGVRQRLRTYTAEDLRAPHQDVEAQD